MAAILPRHADSLLDELLTALPAIMLVGPRAVGKTTLAAARAGSALDLDVPATAAAARLDPDSAIAGLSEPILVDEWQHVPEILGAIKRSIDRDPSPGRFLITGSVATGVEAGTWAGTGRVATVPLWGLSVAERLGRGGEPTFLDRVLDDDRVAGAVDFARSQLVPGDYLDLALASGFPQAALTDSPIARAALLGSYVDQLVLRDVAEIGSRNPTLLRRYLEALAANSAGVVTQATLIQAAGVNRATAIAYEDDLTRTYTLHAAPPWHSNRLSRLVKLPKRYLTDAALIPAALGLDRDAIMRDADLFGRMFDTFVAAQLRIQAGLRIPALRLHHLRDQDGRHEIDLIIDTPRGLIAIEVKATATPDRAAARHLEWLAGELGDRLRISILFTANPQPVQLADRLLALPISALWEGA